MYTLSRAFLDPRWFSACLLNDAGARKYVLQLPANWKTLSCSSHSLNPPPPLPLLEGGGSGDSGGGGRVIFFKIARKRGGGIVSPPAKIREYLVFEIWTKSGIMKKLLRKGVLIERGGRFQIVSSVFLMKSMFWLLLEFLSGKYSHLL